MTLKQWLIDLFKDERGVTSVKPFIALLGVTALIIAMIINLVNHNTNTVDGNLIDAVVVVTVVAMTGDTVDKFSLTKKKTPEPTETPV